jgi:hypothetical protein
MACNRTDKYPNPNATFSDIDVDLPSIDGMLAGTMALMTGYAEHQCEQGNANCRNLMAKKIVSNLYFLVKHPQMSKAMASVMCTLQNHWQTLSALGALEASADNAPGATLGQTSDASSNSVTQHVATPAVALWHADHASLQ